MGNFVIGHHEIRVYFNAIIRNVYMTQVTILVKVTEIGVKSVF